jgi:nucleotide sugar dehydrogenase
VFDSGINKKSEIRCKNFLSKIVNVKKYPLYKLENTNSSEIAKLMENSYRAVNIAFVDEWSRLVENIDANLFDVITAIKKRPTHNNLKDPGFGVGGYCLTKDPLMAMIGAEQIFSVKQDFKFSKLAVKTNKTMPLSTVNKIKKFYNNKLDKLKILLLGVSYKEDIDDTRNSPSEFFLKKMNSLGAKVEVHDPIVRYWKEKKINVSYDIPKIDKFDVIVFAVKHREYKKINFKKWKIKKNKFLIVDANGVLTEKQINTLKRRKLNLISIGR